MAEVDNYLENSIDMKAIIGDDGYSPLNERPNVSYYHDNF